MLCWRCQPGGSNSWWNGGPWTWGRYQDGGRGLGLRAATPWGQEAIWWSYKVWRQEESRCGASALLLDKAGYDKAELHGCGAQIKSNVCLYCDIRSPALSNTPTAPLTTLSSASRWCWDLKFNMVCWAKYLSFASYYSVINKHTHERNEAILTLTAPRELLTHNFLKSFLRL